MLLYFLVVGAIAAAVKSLGEALVSKILLALAGAVAIILAAVAGLALTSQDENTQQQHWTTKALAQLTPTGRLVYYGLCTLLTICLFYTTGLS